MVDVDKVLATKPNELPIKKVENVIKYNELNAESSDSEVEEVYDKTTNFMASSSIPSVTGNGKSTRADNKDMEHQNLEEVVKPRTSGGWGTSAPSLYESWKASYVPDEYNPYDTDEDEGLSQLI